MSVKNETYSLYAFHLVFALTHGGNLKQYDSKTPPVIRKKKKEEKKTHKLFQELNDWNILITSLLVLSLLWQEIKLPKKIFLKTHIRNKLCYGKVLRKMFHLNVNAIGFHSS